MARDPWPPIVFRPLLAGAPDLMGHHRALLDDTVRTNAFIDAIEAQVQPDDVVCDFGAGTGVLSLAAHRAGARRVYAIEHAPIAKLARRVIERNGAASVIEVIERPARRVVLPEPVDVLVSECLGILGLGSTMIAWLCALRDASLAADGIVIPRAITVWLAPVEREDFRAYVFPFEEPRYGFDFQSLDAWPRHNLFNASVEPTDLLCAGAPTITVDLTEDAGGGHDGRATVTIERDGHVHGLIGWFEADLGADHRLSTSPAEPRTVWRQVFLPLEDFEVREGDAIELWLRLDPHPRRRFDITWAARVGDGRWRLGDTRFSHPGLEP